MSLADRLRRGQEWFEDRFMVPEDPLVAVEVRARSVGVVRTVKEGRRRVLAAAASFGLPEGTLALSMVEPNVHDPATFQNTLRTALERAGILSGGRIGLVLPDAVARVALVPQAEITARGHHEIEEMLRFKLRKAVPFEVRDARIAYAQGPPGATNMLVVAMYAPVLHAYEEACRAVGLEPGQVEPSGLALVGAAFGTQSEADRLLVNWDDGYVSIYVARGGWPVVVRTIVGEAAGTPEDVAREVASTLVYYRERLGGSTLAGAVVRSGAAPPEQAVALLEGVLGFRPQPVEPWGSLGNEAVRHESQALAGAAACVAGRAAA